MSRVLVAGSFNVDHVWTAARLPRPGETLAGRYAIGPGGKGFNQAVAARRTGAKTTFLCALGADSGGALARDLARKDGIDLREAPSAAPTGTAGIYLDDAGNNCIVIGPGANADLSPDFVASQVDAFIDAAVVLVQLESPSGAVLAALRRARADGALAILNPAPANVEVGPELLEYCDILTPNETEFAGLLKRRLDQLAIKAGAGALPDPQLHALCRELLPHGTVVLTLGGAGCFVSHPAGSRRADTTEYYRVAAAPADVVDTTGAGDAFNGALAAVLALRPAAQFAAQIAFATRYAAAATEQVGAAASMPRLSP